MIPEFIYETLSSDPAIAGVVGARIYPLRAPQSTAAPYIVYSRVSQVPDLVMSGRCNSSRARIQIDVYGRTYAEACEIRDRIDELLHGTSSGDVWRIRLESSMSLYNHGDRFYREMLDFSVLYSSPSE